MELYASDASKPQSEEGAHCTYRQEHLEQGAVALLIISVLHWETDIPELVRPTCSSSVQSKGWVVWFGRKRISLTSACFLQFQSARTLI